MGFEQEGWFSGVFEDATLEISKENKLPMFAGILRPDGYLEGDEIIEFDEENKQTVYARMCLYTKAGDPMYCCADLTKALNMKRLVLTKLIDMDVDKLPRVLFKVVNEPYEKDGVRKDSFKVVVIMNIDDRPKSGLRKASVDDVAEAAKRFGEFTPTGTATGKRPAKPSKPGKPKANPTAQPKSTSRPKPKPVVDADPADTAWNAFTALNPDLSEDDLNTAWWDVLTNSVGNTDTVSFDTDDWNKVFTALGVPF